MKQAITKIDQFHQTKKGKLTFGAIELLLAYALVSKAIDTGSLWQYLLFILLFIGGVSNLLRVVLPSRAKNAATKKSSKR